MLIQCMMQAGMNLRCLPVQFIKDDAKIDQPIR